MSDIWTKVATIFASLLGGLALASGALAVEATNSNTGAGSDNDAKVKIENDLTISSNNEAVITNNIDIWANTGNNSADKNTGDGSVSTGDITGSVSIINTGNENGLFDSSLTINCNGACDFSASNSNTGANSDNDANVHVSNDIDITLNNEAYVDNYVGADLNTGGNSADKNTGDGSISTGDIDFSVEVVNDLNKNFIGGPVPEGPTDPGEIPPAILPSAPKPGKVLAAAEGLPITGGSLPNWPFLLIAAGFVMRILERVFRTRFGEVA